MPSYYWHKMQLHTRLHKYDSSKDGLELMSSGAHKYHDQPFIVFPKTRLHYLDPWEDGTDGQANFVSMSYLKRNVITLP